MYEEVENIDFYKEIRNMQKSMSKERLLYYFKNNTPFCFLPAYIRNARISDSNKIFSYFNKELEGTINYADCIRIYSDILDKISILCKKIDINTSYELIFFYEAMLFCNLLSKKGDRVGYTAKCLPKGIISDYLEHYNLLGSRVMTGKYTCRHISGLLSDIINRVGGVDSAKNIFVYTQSKNKGKINTNISPNHALTAIRDENGKFFGYCATNHEFIVSCDSDDYGLEFEGYSLDFKRNTQGSILYNEKHSKASSEITNNFIDIKDKDRLCNILNKSLNAACDKFSKYEYDIVDFYKDIVNDYDILNEKTNLILPDKKVKKLVLQKPIYRS